MSRPQGEQRGPVGEPLVLRGHVHDAHELAWMSWGSARVTIGDRTWSLGPSQALWIPAGVEHDVEIEPGCMVRPHWFDPGWSPFQWDEPTAIWISPPVGAELARLTQMWITGLASDHDTCAQLVDLLSGLGAGAAMPLVLPRHAAARELALAVLDRPGEQRSLDEVAKTVGCSGRTVRRAFLAETGLGYGEWRARARIHAAARALGHGDPVARVARDVGYDSVNGFIESFRRHVGVTPGAYRRSLVGQA